VLSAARFREGITGMGWSRFRASYGCAAERDPINRVQALALPKSFFVGEKLADPSDDPEFYMRTTLVDVSAGAGSDGLFTSSDAQPTTRIRWEITEKKLYARLTYELIQDTDHKGTRPTPDGQVVAAFEIEKHFDIRRDYNQTTGEEQNTIVENDTDRPWYERQYFRVNWSTNLVTDAFELDALSQLGIYYGVKWNPVSYTITDQSSSDKPVFDVEHGYFDVTNKAYAAPQVVHDEELGDFPACWLVGAWPATSCNPSEVTLRLSFKKVEDHDYEPLEYDGNRMELFGWFTVDRLGYDRKYGIVDDKWHRFAARWNLYEKSHAQPVVECATPATTPIGKDPHRDEDGDGTEDECAKVGKGSRCDAFRGECTMPLRDRKVKTIPWYVNQGYPEDLFDAAKDALAAWNDAVRVAVVAGRLAECRRTKEQGCEAQMGWPERWSDDFVPPVGGDSPAKVPNVFVLCHNPVDDTKDDPACGAKGLSPRLGDLRYHFITMIQSPQIQRPWGIMVDAEDPLTGEKIAGSVNQWSATLDRAAATLVDILGLLNGEIAPDKFIDGKDVSAWVRANRGGEVDRGAAMSAAELDARMNAFDRNLVKKYTSGLAIADKNKPAPLRHKLRARALSDAGRLGPGNAALSQNVRALRGTNVEAKMVTPELVQAAGHDPTAAVSPDVVKRASPFGRFNPALRRALVKNKRLARARRHSCAYEGPEPDNLIGLAKQAQKLFGKPDPNDPAAVAKHRDEVYQWARKTYALGVFAHELGHSMGLRHNFAASFDSLNYRPEYWQLRTRNGEVTQPCAPGTTDGTNCIGPRYKDPIAQYEIDGNINRYATTSVMDYPGDQNHDQLSVGAYDRAAMRFGYGDVVDVWNKPGVSVTGSGAGQDLAYKLTAFTSSPGLFGVFWFPAVNPAEPARYIHYSQYQKEFGLLSDCAPDSSDGAILGKKCKTAPMDVVSYRDMKSFAPDPAYASYSWAQAPRAIDAKGRVRRGYMFSSDEYADSGNVPSFSYDAGADAYEQIRFLESQYENRYILDAFRRNRVQFNSADVSARIQAHYLDAIQQITKSFAFGALLDDDPAAPSAAFLQDGNFGPLGVASSVAFDLFARILTRPDPGSYCNADECGAGSPYGVDVPIFVADPAPTSANKYDFRVALGEGRFLHNDFDYGKGYWWSDYQKQVGSYYDKIFATYYLAEAFDTFISNSKEDFVDSRYKNVSFATIYPEQVRRLFANLLTGDWESFAPWTVAGQGTPEVKLSYPRWFDAKSWGTRPQGAKIVDPNWGFNEQLYMMVWGAMFFPTNWSMSWINDARITALGQDQVFWPAAETYTYFDPASGITYRAHAIGTESVFGVDHEKGIGARMLEFANKLVMYAYKVETDAQGNVILNANGTPKLVLDASGHPQKDPNYPGADAVVQKYADQIALMRQLTSTFARGTDTLPGN
jgi:hypothetical protein